MTASRRGEPCGIGGVAHTIGHCDYYHEDVELLELRAELLKLRADRDLDQHSLRHPYWHEGCADCIDRATFLEMMQQERERDDPEAFQPVCLCRFTAEGWVNALCPRHRGDDEQ